ncbi:hypothetical protein OGAPHI_005135 [Ogataea philodendri]|uniref:Uncharacterized protein n=1 Tax=Ogataea philodendri TaxID=1378263 RepID=A0A9P8P1C3_9ASCO|nr:uncharacterized protein OGAPHI_005135 [Ogataea philodendri]KAH3663733.1 hypothetical protein OGAPHI_005135 [Ogataea philodendri]
MAVSWPKFGTNSDEIPSKSTMAISASSCRDLLTETPTPSVSSIASGLSTETSQTSTASATWNTSFDTFSTSASTVLNCESETYCFTAEMTLSMETSPVTVKTSSSTTGCLASRSSLNTPISVSTAIFVTLIALVASDSRSRCISTRTWQFCFSISKVRVACLQFVLSNKTSLKSPSPSCNTERKLRFMFLRSNPRMSRLRTA